MSFLSLSVTDLAHSIQFTISMTIKRAFEIGFYVCPSVCLFYVYCFQISIFQLFEDLEGWNSEYKVITPKSITGLNHLGTMAGIKDFVKSQYLSRLKSYKNEIWKLTLIICRMKEIYLHIMHYFRDIKNT